MIEASVGTSPAHTARAAAFRGVSGQGVPSRLCLVKVCLVDTPWKISQTKSTSAVVEICVENQICTFRDICPFCKDLFVLIDSLVIHTFNSPPTGDYYFYGHHTSPFS